MVYSLRHIINDVSALPSWSPPAQSPLDAQRHQDGITGRDSALDAIQVPAASADDFHSATPAATKAHTPLTSVERIVGDVKPSALMKIVMDCGNGSPPLLQQSVIQRCAAS
jgi:hypothetical protein